MYVRRTHDNDRHCQHRQHRHRQHPVVIVVVIAILIVLTALELLENQRTMDSTWWLHGAPLGPRLALCTYVSARAFVHRDGMSTADNRWNFRGSAYAGFTETLRGAYGNGRLRKHILGKPPQLFSYTIFMFIPGPSKYPQIGAYGPKLRVFRVFRVDGGSRYLYALIIYNL